MLLLAVRCTFGWTPGCSRASGFAAMGGKGSGMRSTVVISMVCTVRLLADLCDSV